MTIIKKYKDLKDFEQSNLDIDLNVSSDEIIIKTSFEIKDFGLQKETTSLKFADLRAREDEGGFNRWILEVDKSKKHLPIKNLYVQTYVSKLEAKEYATETGTASLVHVIVKPEDTSFDDAVIIISNSDNSKFTSNLDFEEIEMIRTDKDNKTYTPKYDLDEIKRNDDGSISFQLTAPSNVNQTFYIKSDLGFAPSTFKVVSGVGSFNFIPLGLNKGDKAIIKVGLKFYSNIVSAEVII